MPNHIKFDERYAKNTRGTVSRLFRLTGLFIVCGLLLIRHTKYVRVVLLSCIYPSIFFCVLGSEPCLIIQDTRHLLLYIVTLGM